MNAACTVFVGDAIWYVGVARKGEVTVRPIPVEEDATRERRAEAARGVLTSLRWGGEPVVLAIPSAWCLAATISTDDLDRGGRRRAMSFRLEEYLPVSAEETVADYVEVEDEALGVCVEFAKLRPVIEALQAADVDIRHVCPAVLLAAEDAAEMHPDLGAVLVARTVEAHDETTVPTDLVELAGGRPVHWWWHGGDEAAARRRLAAWAENRGETAQLAVASDGRSPVAAAEATEETAVHDLTPWEAAARRAAAALVTGTSPWIDLRRDELAAPGRHRVYRKPAAALVTAIAVLLAAIWGVSWWRGRAYEALAETYYDRQRDVWRGVIPAGPIPMRRLEIERDRLAGIGGQAGDDASAVGGTVSALKHLGQVLTNLPSDVRYRITDLRIKPDRIDVDAEARDYRQAERLALALRESGLYDVELGKRQALSDRGVSVLFTARPRRNLGEPEEGGAS